MIKIAKHLCTTYQRNKQSLQILSVSSHFCKFIVATRS